MSNSTFLGMVLLPLLALSALLGLMLYQDHLSTLPPEGLTQAQQAATEQALLRDVRALLEVHFDGEVKPEVLFRGQLSGMSGSLKDRYTSVLFPVEATKLSEESAGAYGGLGVTVTPNNDGTLTISRIAPESPALGAGFKMGDRIVGMRDISAGKDAISFVGYVGDKTKLMRGPSGTTIEVMIERADDKKTILVERGLVPIHSVQGTRMVDEEHKVGYLRLNQFNSNSPEQLLEAIEKLRALGARRLILDLRDNGGGLLNTAVEIADMFIAEEDKVVVSTKASQAKLERLKELKIEPDLESRGRVMKTQDDEAQIDMPTVVLMNSRSASASEVLAGALQDYNLVLILGTPSYGKGVVQRPFPVPADPRYMVKITIATYFTPLGNNLHRATPNGPGGITPDVIYPMSTEQESQMIQRFNIQAYELPAEGESFPNEEDQAAWAAADPQIDAAIKLLLGERIEVPVHAGGKVPAALDETDTEPDGEPEE